MVTGTHTMRLYVASLSDYNAGRLHGVWIDVSDMEEDDLWERVNGMLKASPEARHFPQGGPAEEWAIHDYEGFEPWSISEYESFKTILLAAHLVREKGEVALHWLGNDDSMLGRFAGDPDGLCEEFDGCYSGEWESREQYARNYVSELGLPGIGGWHVSRGQYGERVEQQEVLDELDSYLDWDRLAEWALGDMIEVEHGGSLYVFRTEA